MRYGHRFWDDRTPVGRRASSPRWKPARGQASDTADVVIVGGGLTGCASAYAFASAGYDVVLLEAGRLAGGATASSAGLMLPGFDAPFASHSAAFGLRASRAMWQQARRGSMEFAALLRRLAIKCDLDATSVLVVSRDAKALGKEYSARKGAGLSVTRVAPAALSREAAIDAAALRMSDAFTFDPVRAALGLSAHARKQGARVFEQSTVTRIRHLPRGKGVQVKTAAGTIEARTAVVATGLPGALVPQLRRHFIAHDTYAVVTDTMPAAMRRAVGSRTSAVMDTETPPHTLRWMKDDRVMMAGADQPPVPARQRDRALVQRTGQLMYELSLFYPELSGIQPAFAWDAPLASTADGAPFIGPHRNLPGHLFALGLGRHGDGLAWTAARALVRHFADEPSKEDSVFGFERSGR